MNKKISLIIVTYNSNDLIEDCLNSIFKFNDIGDDLEIIIVDNSLKEDSEKLSLLLMQKYNSNVIYIRNSKNGGYGNGNNLGVMYSKGEYICVMNPDIRLLEPVFKKVLNKFERNSNLAMLGLKQIGGENLSFYFRPEKYLPFFSIFVKLLNKCNIYLNDYMFLSGAFIFLRKEHFVSIGKYDENIFLYNEESDLTNRFLKSNYDIKYCPNLCYLHEIGDRSEWSDFTFKIWLDSRLYYFSKFSFNKNVYFKGLLFELRLKVFFYKLLGKKSQLDVTKKFIQKILALNN